MKTHIFIFISLLCFSYTGSVYAQKKGKGSAEPSYTSGIGVHLGDPFAISYKKNMGMQAFEVNLGITPYFGGYDIGNYFDNGSRFKGKGYHLDNGTYSAGLVMQFHYLFHYALPLEGLRWYWGLGPQFRMRGYTVSYHDNFGYYTSDNGVELGLGLDGVVGAEYKFKKMPLAVYADIVPYMQFIGRFWVYPTGGIGARYTF